MMKQLPILFFISLGLLNSPFAQTADPVKSVKDTSFRPYFIITAGTTINAYFNDKPLNVETIMEFDDYVQRNSKSLKNARVIVTGKPKTGTYDDVLKTLKRNRVKNITTNVPKD